MGGGGGVRMDPLERAGIEMHGTCCETGTGTHCSGIARWEAQLCAGVEGSAPSHAWSPLWRRLPHWSVQAVPSAAPAEMARARGLPRAPEAE